jgi:KDO2-lipid IV(A) lauroyltransferase
MLTEAGPRPPLTPRFWLGWLGVSFIWLMGKTPQWLGLFLSQPLAVLLRLAMKSRSRIAERNIQRCFPGMPEEQRQVLLRACFQSLARAVFEIAWSWSASDRRIARMGHIEGLEHVETARQGGRGVLFITAHISCLEIGGRLLAGGLEYPISGIYRPLSSPVLEWYQNRSRLSYGDGMISKRDVRSAIRLLRRGGMVWYAPDQDFGPDQSVFAPFFGIQTASLLATHRLAKMTGCAVIPMFPVYDVKTRRYTVHILPVIESLPGEDAETDLAQVNAIMEEHIRSAPEQYWWIHRRFKTRPPGEKPFYA